MARPSTTLKSCSNCRKRKTKCNGQSPCSACQSRQEECVYYKKKWDSKDELRVELDRLRAGQQNANVLFEALKSEDFGVVLQSLQRGDSVSKIAGQFPSSIASHAAQSHIPEVDTPEPDYDDQDERSDDHQLQDTDDAHQPDDSCSSRPSPLGGVTSPEESVYGQGRLRTNSSYSSAPSSASTPFTQPNTPSYNGVGSPKTVEHLHSSGTASKTGGTAPSIFSFYEDELAKKMFNFLFVQQNCQLFLTYYPQPFSMFDGDAFISDFATGGRQFSSPALVAAVLSVSSRLWEDGSYVPNGNGPSDFYYRETKRLLPGDISADDLPNIQALGLLALEEVSRGDEEETSRLLYRCIDNLRKSRPRPEVLKQSDRLSHSAVNAATFCGAVTMQRFIILIVRHEAPLATLPDSRKNQESAESITSSAVVPTQEVAMLWPGVRRRLLWSQLIPSFIYELTELVHSSMSTDRMPRNHLLADASLDAYEKCLTWYSSTLAALETGPACSPFLIFIHMYYQFCLLTLLRPLTNSHPGNIRVSPQKVCAEASEAILSLVRSYGELFTFRRTSCFIPYLAYAAGASLLDLSHLDSEEASVSGGEEIKWFPGSKNEAKAKLDSLVDQAIDQLSEMAVVHPAAIPAKEALFKRRALQDIK